MKPYTLQTLRTLPPPPCAPPATEPISLPKTMAAETGANAQAVPPGAFAVGCMCGRACQAWCPATESGELSDKQRHMMSLRMDGEDDFSADALRRVRRQNVEKVLQELKSCAGNICRMCDVGSGTGELSTYMATQLGADLTCYDVALPENNAQSISAIVGNGCAATIKVFNGTELPEADDSFDLVSCVFVLHHAGQAQVPLLSDMMRISKNWILICEDTNEDEFRNRNFMHDRNGVFRTHTEWCALFEKLDLHLVAEGRCRESGPQQYYLLQKRTEPLTPASVREVPSLS